MFDIGWQELFVVALLALIVVGPKDLPRAIRTMSAWIRKARKLGHEFQAGVNEMVREAELDDVKKQLTDGKKLGADLGKEFSQSLEFDEDEDRTIGNPQGDAPAEVIDVVAQDVSDDGSDDETVMPVSGGDNEQPIISLDDDVMPLPDQNVPDPKTEPSR